MDISRLTLEEVFLLLAFVNDMLATEKNVKLDEKKDKLHQEILNRLDKI